MNEPYRICSETAEEHALDVTIKQSEAENFGDISEAAKIIRKELQHQPKWRFNGTFEDFKTSMQLRCFIAEVLTTNNSLHERALRITYCDRSSSF